MSTRHCWIFLLILTLVGLSPRAIAASHATLGSMVDNREEQTATLLNNGQVLVAGGTNNGDVLSSAELYNPTGGVWGHIAGLATARRNHTATLLPSGKVLVAGGFLASGTTVPSEIYDPAPQVWFPAGTLLTSRFSHTATLLPNGQVLFAGGISNDGTSTVLKSAELYDPVAQTYTATGNLHTGRWGATMTLLPNGKVLIAGGAATVTGTILSSAELYDPSTGKWTVTGSLHKSRVFATATLLATGKVLVAAGGSNLSGGVVATSETFDPGTGLWTVTAGSLATARENATATLLPNGQVLVAGGKNSTGNLGSTEVFDPVAGTWSAGSPLDEARSSHTATLLAGGQILLAAGNDIDGFDFDQSEVYDPGVGTFTVTGSLNTARAGQTSTLLPNGQVLVAAGLSGGDFTNGFTYTATAELYNPATAAWTATGNLLVAREFATATLLPSGLVLVAGGTNGSVSVSEAELYNPATGTWTATGSMTAVRDQHTATLLPNGQVLVTGGNGDNSIRTSAELYDPATGKWTATGSMFQGRSSHTATLLPNGIVLVSGGFFGGPVNTAELYDPSTGKWKKTGKLITARQSHSATLLPSGLVLAAGGQGDNFTTLTSAELYDPSSGTWSATGSLLTGRYAAPATLLPGGQVLVQGGAITSLTASNELYNPATGVWTATGVAEFGYEPEAATLLLNGQVLSAGGGTPGRSFVESIAQIYDPGLGFTSATQPTLTTIPDINPFGGTITGMGFTGFLEASGGQTNNSASNVPVVKLQSLGNEQVITLESGGFTGTTLNALVPVFEFPPGPALATVFVNGTPSVSKFITYNLAPQTITFPPIADQTFPVAPFSTGAFASSGSPLTYTVSGPAMVTGNIVTVTGAGTISIRAHQDGFGLYYAPAPSVAQSFKVSKGTQTITFPAIANQSFGAPLTLTGTATSGLAVTYTVTSGPATVSGNVLTFTGLGAVTVTASQPGNAGYLAAADVPESFTVKKETQTVTFPAIANRAFSPVPFALGATASSGLPVTYSATGPIKIAGGMATLTGIGPVRIRASQAGNANVGAAPGIVNSFTVTQGTQTITFPAVAAQVFGGKVTLKATASSGLAVTYSIVSGPATISGKVVTFTGVGTVKISASQAGNANYAAATAVRINITVNKAPQKITFPAIGNRPLDSGSFTLNATSSSGGAITYAAFGKATVSGNVVTPTGAGTVRITADQPGDANHLPAPEVAQKFTVTASNGGG